MKKTLLLAISAALAALLAACGASGASASEAAPASGESSALESAPAASSPETPEKKDPPYRLITAQEAKQMMDEGRVTIVDVRTVKEYEEAHIKDAVNVPNETISGEMPEALPDTDATLLLYCRTGIRAAQAAQKLANLGYQTIYSFGGIVDWPYETE